MPLDGRQIPGRECVLKNHHITRWVWLGVVLLTGPATRAADPEQRVYTVLVDGKPAGEYRTTLRTDDDGSETVTCAASVHVRHLLGQYHYSYQGTEVWKGGKLQRLDAVSNDDGKKNAVRATADTGGL